MTLPGFAPWLPWPRQADAALTSPRRAFCERIICVHGKHTEIGWWHDLERDDELLFVDAKRIVESSLDDVGDCVESAVADGYRPVVFVDRMSDWPRAHAALGRYQAFGEVLVLGRDDVEMSELLHVPSNEIRRVFEDGGRIVVPNLEYGKALDGYLLASLEDFMLTELDQKDPLAPCLKLVSRLNAFRHMELTLYCRNGTARLKQAYRERGATTAVDERCVQPVRFREWVFDFARSNVLSTNNSAVLDEPMEFARAVAETFELPMAYQGWETGHAPPWKGLLAQLAKMSRGVMTHLTSVQQALLVGEGNLKEAISEMLGSLQMQPVAGPVRGVQSGNRDSAGADDQLQKGVLAVVLVREPAAEAVLEKPAMVFAVKWLTAEKPTSKPIVVVEHDEQQLPSDVASWSENLQSLTISDVHAAETDVGWLWSTEENTLTVSLRKSTQRDSGA